MLRFILRFLYKLKFYKLIGFFYKQKIDKQHARKAIDEVYPTKDYVVASENEKTPISHDVDLSIIVPVYNTEVYLDSCLESLVTQDTKYVYEIILVNDGSKDNSLSIIKKWHEKSLAAGLRCHIIDQSNKGLGAARNAGINIASGKYIGFVDSDDYVDSSFVNKMLKTAIKYDADIVKCNYSCFNEEGILYSANKTAGVSHNKYDEIVINCDGFAWNGIYRSNIVKKYKFPEKYMFEDMIIKLAFISDIKCFCQIEDKLYYFRKNMKSLSRNAKNYCNYRILDQLFLPQMIISKNGIKIEAYNFNLVLYEYSAMLFFRTRRLPKKIRISAFTLACDYIVSIYKSNYYNNLSDLDQRIIKAMLKSNYLEWKYLSIFKYFNI